MKYILAPKEADKAYISNRLWLPKSKVRVGPVKKALEFTVGGKDGQQVIKLWDESSNHIICPREFLPTSQYSKYPFPFIDLRPDFKHVEFKDLVNLRNEEQETAWAALSMNDNGILNLGCGKGKTKLALKKIAQRGIPTLVIVPDGGMLDQWRKSIYGDDRTPPGLSFDFELGIIQGSEFNITPLTLALVTSLWPKIERNEIPEEIFRYFGLIVYDEVHQIGATKFSLTAPPFHGDRIGLTATVEREDGLDPIYRYHIGEPFYIDLKQDLIPNIYFQQTPIKLDHTPAIINGMTNISIMRSMIGNDKAGNIYRYWSIKQAVDEGRKILCLSHSKAQLKLMHAMFPGSGLIIQETDREDRLDVLRNHSLCFAISRLGSVGIDDDRLDALFWLTPFRSKVSLQQSMGRIQRFLPGKKTPVMVVFEDWTTKPLKTLCVSIKSTLRHWGFAFETIKPLKVPTELPKEIEELYDREADNLSGIDTEIEDDSDGEGT
jgi:superfamily II DNA or RNA helicase